MNIPQEEQKQNLSEILGITFTEENIKKINQVVAKQREAQKRYYEKNREKIIQQSSERTKKWRQTERGADKAKKINDNYRKNNKERILKANSIRGKIQRTILRIQELEQEEKCEFIDTKLKELYEKLNELQAEKNDLKNQPTHKIALEQAKKATA